MTFPVLLGQALGIVGLLLTFVSYQTKTPRALLVLQTASTALFVVHYMLIGADSGFLLNIVCIVRNVAYFFEGKREHRTLRLPLSLATLFSAALIVLCALSWQGWYSLLITVALVVNTYFLSLGKQNLLRASVIGTSSLILVYNILVFSIGGIANESIAIISSAIGLVRAKKAQK
jgi:hypothetical protein